MTERPLQIFLLIVVLIAFGSGSVVFWLKIQTPEAKREIAALLSKDPKAIPKETLKPIPVQKRPIAQNTPILRQPTPFPLSTILTLATVASALIGFAGMVILGVGSATRINRGEVSSNLPFWPILFILAAGGFGWLAAHVTY